MRRRISLLAAASVCLSGTLAYAQAVAPSAPARPLGGDPVPGMCFLAQTAVLTNAKVGIAATTRLKQIADAADAELKAKRDPLDADAKALQSMQATLSAVDLQTRRQALANSSQALDQLTQQRRQEVELTRQKAVAQIDTMEQPIIADVYAAHHCGLLLDRNNVLGGNMAGDLTTDVVKGLDAKMTTITFDRASLPAQTASAASAPSVKKK